MEPRLPRQLMVSFAGQDGDELCLLGVPGATENGSCSHQKSFSALLGPAEIGGTKQHAAGRAKVGQLLVQWFALPATDSLVQLKLSDTRRVSPVFDVWNTPRHENPASLHAAASALHRTRWSVSCGSPRRHVLPLYQGYPLRVRRNSEPDMPTRVSYVTPPGPWSPIVPCDVSEASNAGSVCRRSCGLKQPTLLLGPRAKRSFHREVLSPLSYFGRPNRRAGERSALLGTPAVT